MIHYGDITKINGAEVPVVDIVTGGSPCQDLSVAGKRAGLAGERSGLFMEQIRVIKEMRDYDRSSGRADVDIRPRFMVWENVPGAFSSNHGEDFRAVLEETAKVAKRDACIPGPPGGKWTHAGCIMGDGWIPKERYARNPMRRSTKRWVIRLHCPSGSGWLRGWFDYSKMRSRLWHRYLMGYPGSVWLLRELVSNLYFHQRLKSFLLLLQKNILAMMI